MTGHFYFIILAKRRKYDENPYPVKKPNGLKLIGKSGHNQVWRGLRNEKFLLYIFGKTDREPFIKLYPAKREQLKDLSYPARKCFDTMIFLLPINDNKIKVSIKDLMQEHGYTSRMSITTAINELIDNNLIQKGKERGTYYINPGVAFNGNRAKLIKNN